MTARLPDSPEARRQTPGAIRRMFEAVAPRYDRMNRILSVGLDQGWRRAALRELDASRGARILDLCCGTGDLSLLLPRDVHPVGCDLTPAMLEIADAKAVRYGKLVHGVAGDALRLPFGAGVFDGAVVGFGIRNLPDLHRGFAEIRRVLAPGGKLVILEFSQPENRLVRLGHGAWLRIAVPGLAWLASSGTEPYEYLRDSILGFPDADALAGILRATGFSTVSYHHLALGTVAIHSGHREDLPAPRN
jgi:demethylmenaquinone methyltransferase/2-methoxy-6-polyprenyl-1,4-benzoquinol methylase